ncbi:MAG TPA: LTA synthase family protein [Stellaceae bacterium]|nr:LTA synthase family protein [Stellaceae bacterium]
MGAVGLVHLAAGEFLALLAWLMPRHVARARRAAPAVVLLDLAPIVLGAGLLGLAAGKPLFAGLVTLALGAGFALTDYTMRQTLREPVVFSAASELPQVFTHPHLYLPFAGPVLVVGGAAAAILMALAFLLAEPPLWTPHPVDALLAVALLAACLWLLAREPLLGAAARALRRLDPTGEPFADAAALGPFAMLLVHATIARAERSARQVALAAPLVVREPTRGSVGAQVGGLGGPIIIVQCESFFDARRLSPRIPCDLLPGFDACCAASAAYGRLAVPAWGANTMRAEFAVLTGTPESELGFDRFNPYYALARVPIESQVWRLRRAGYRTICLHPFDRRFFRRDLAMPALGFERFLGREVLGGSAVPPYCPDPEFAGQILRILAEEGPQTLIFAITMGNHGPWPASGPPIDPAVAAIFDNGQMPDHGELLRYLDGLRRSDAMLQVLMEGLARHASPSVLAFYGDHLPSLGAAFDHFGFDEWSSDYAIWPGPGAPQRRDLQVHDLLRLIVDAVLGAGPVSALDLGACRPSGPCRGVAR